jgi:hypothetical protein
MTNVNSVRFLGVGARSDPREEGVGKGTNASDTEVERAHDTETSIEDGEGEEIRRLPRQLITRERSSADKGLRVMGEIVPLIPRPDVEIKVDQGGGVGGTLIGKVQHVVEVQRSLEVEGTGAVLGVRGEDDRMRRGSPGRERDRDNG